ncbi:MAG: aldehyde dehydrogenase family protein, partial [Rhodocyclaceae bacterium]|nr:aldehyde dehydrogenase family protein [Rhodocyclaceae bacterium]
MSLTYTSAPEAIGHWIDNEAQTGGGRSQPVYDPALGKVARRVALATEAEVNAAVASAAAAQPAWAGTAPQKRARVLFKMRDLVERHTDDQGTAPQKRARVLFKMRDLVERHTDDL